MIEEPPLLTVKRPDRRPSAQQIAAFQNVPTSFVVDSLQGGHTLASNIRPIGESRDINCTAAGPALTVDNGPGDILALLGALAFVQPEDIVVTAFHGHQGCASCGDRVCAMAKNGGAAGLVTDGPARDYQGIVEVGLPVWCTGLTPNTPYSKGPGKIGLPIQIGGCQVENGDMIVADFDGVAVVPFDRIDDVIAALKDIVALEEVDDAKIRAGLKVRPAMVQLLDSSQTKYV